LHVEDDSWPRKKSITLLTANDEIRTAVEELIAEVSAEPLAIAA